MLLLVKNVDSECPVNKNVDSMDWEIQLYVIKKGTLQYSSSDDGFCLFHLTGTEEEDPASAWTFEMSTWS
jgi:hypothetical protein